MDHDFFSGEMNITDNRYIQFNTASIHGFTFMPGLLVKNAGFWAPLFDIKVL